MTDPLHPIWSIARLLIYMIGLVVILYVNASHFDETELRTIISMFLVGAGGETIQKFFAKSKGS